MDKVQRYTSPRFIAKALEDIGKKPTKGLGQNFLIDQDVINKIVSSAGVNSKVGVIEIGPGLGALTHTLINSAGRVFAIEIDDKLWGYLDDEFGFRDTFHLVKGDVLKVDLKSICYELHREYDDIYVVANLPYHITTPIIMKFLEEGIPVSKLVVMVQKEVALRMSAEPGNKDYGALTVSLSSFADVNILFDIKPSSFIPRPKVVSSVVEIVIRPEKNLSDDERDFFMKLVRAGFHARRKKLVNSASPVLGISKEKIIEALVKIGKEENVRAEVLSPEDFRDLAKAISNY